MKKKILLHICCGPCAIYPIEYLKNMDFEVTGLYYNPNIHPLMEYIKRRDALLEVAKYYNIKIILKDKDYCLDDYFRKVVFRENNRCFYCYQMRIEKTVSIANKGKFDYFTTTLLYSKFQKHNVIKSLCEDLRMGKKVKFFYHDFREGWKYGIDKSKELNIYRQQYCGCIYSEFERFKKELNN